jgi:hypothetical protein
MNTYFQSITALYPQFSQKRIEKAVSELQKGDHITSLSGPNHLLKLPKGGYIVQSKSAGSSMSFPRGRGHKTLKTIKLSVTGGRSGGSESNIAFAEDLKVRVK